MITKCRIEWIDDGTEYDVFICESYDYHREDDDDIFFYGMSYRKCKRVMENKIVCEGEWMIKKIY